MSSEFYREPIMWTSPNPGYNAADRERRSFRDGKEVVERVPQIGHVGDYENKRQAPGIRYIEVVRHEGHVAPIVLTSAAAHLDANTSYGLQQRGKCIHFGWFPIGVCPVALLGTGELNLKHVRDKSLLSAQPCPPGSCDREHRCSHSLSEQKARSEWWSKAEAERAAAYKTSEEKLADAYRDGNREIGNVIADALRAVATEKKGK